MLQGGLLLLVEKFLEPYSGMRLLGVSGFGTADLKSVEILGDGQLWLSLTPKGESNAFSGHGPIGSIQQFQVIAKFKDGRESVWLDQPIGSIIDRSSIKPPPPNGLRKLKQTIKCALTFAKELPEKIEYRLFKRRYPARPHYDSYVEAATPAKSQLDAMRSFTFQKKTIISILCPVFNVEPKWLAKAVGSVQQQPYPHWELCLADDRSTKKETIDYLKSISEIDPRIKVVFRETNGHICAATNSAAALATGEFIALMDNDDCLAVDALFHVAMAMQQNPQADLIYSDEDKCDENDRRYDPQFKPDWSPELLLSYNYINHFTVIRRSLFESVGRYRLGFEGSQDHDMLLRVTEKTDRVVHIPRVLYH